MRFIIKYDTGNIEDDVYNTIVNFSDDEMETFINEIKLIDLYSEIKGSTIVFRYPDADKALSTITDVRNYSIEEKKAAFKLKKQYDGRVFKFDTTKIFDKRGETPFSSKVAQIVEDKIDVRKSFCEALGNEQYDNSFYERCFEILSSDEAFKKFVYFDDYREMFGEDLSQRDYVLQISKLLGDRAKDVERKNKAFIYGLVDDGMIRRYRQLRSLVNVDLEMLGTDPFEYDVVSAYSLEKQKETDNDWEVNPELLAYVLSDMDPDYSSLEKIAHIYIKLCYALRYNMGYTVFKYDTIYRRDRQEAISLDNNEVICSEFSILYAKLLNQIDGVDARVVRPSNGPHITTSVLVEDEDILLYFDSTNLLDNYDDLGRAKLGLSLIGVRPVCDRNGDFSEAFNKVYERFKEKQLIPTENVISAYESKFARNSIPVDFEENMTSFMEKMERQGVTGSEMYNVFQQLVGLGYFGSIRYALVGENMTKTFTERMNTVSVEERLDGMEESVIIVSDIGKLVDDRKYYLLRLNQHTISDTTSGELNELFDSDKMRYYNLEYKIEGIGKNSSSELKVRR